MNVAVTTAAEGFPRRAFTVEDVSRMIDAGVIGEDEKFELIEGEIVMMAPKGIAHERIKSALIVAIARALPNDLALGVEITLRLTNTILLEPDFAIFPKELFQRSDSGFAQLDPGEARLVVEVAHTSLAYDKRIKAPIYARHGVWEYWIVDVNTRVTWIYTGPGAEGWSSIVKRGSKDALTTPTLPGFSFRLNAID